MIESSQDVSPTFVDLTFTKAASGRPLCFQASWRRVDIVLGMLEERVAQDDAKGGFILDGYPRNVAQCAALEALLERLRQPLDIAVKLEVPSELIVERIAGRAAAEGRVDDTPETVRARLRVYAEQTAPVADHFAEIGKLVSVDGVGELDQVFQRILDALPT